MLVTGDRLVRPTSRALCRNLMVGSDGPPWSRPENPGPTAAGDRAPGRPPPV